jgi:hypothetical protein
MALLHETLYKTGVFAEVDLASYLRGVASHLFRSLNEQPARIQLVLDLSSVKVGIDQAIPCGLIVNELVTNMQTSKRSAGTPSACSWWVTSRDSFAALSTSARAWPRASP